MAGIPKVKITFDADLEGLKSGVKNATTEVEGFGSKMADFGKKAAAAFAVAAAAAAAYAVKIGIDGVKAAIDDEKAQVKLAGALERATGATKEQIAAVEEQILKTSLATGVADDQLRPALARLALSTGDTAKAQDLLNTALDISAATGKPLEGVANALGKAYDGNTGALGKLGLGLSAAELKTMSFTEVQTKLSDLFGGAAAANAETFQGRLDRLKVGLNEAKETIGFALLPILQELIGYFNAYVLPVIQKVTDSFSENAGGLGNALKNVVSVLKTIFIPIFDAVKTNFMKVKDTITENIDEFKNFWEVIKFIAPLIGSTIGAAIKVIGGIADVVLNVIANVLGAIKPLLNTAIDGINLVIRGLNLINPFSDIPYLPKIGDSTGGGSNLGSRPMGATGTSGASGGGGGLTLGGGGGGGTSGAAGGSVGGTVNSQTVKASSIDPMGLLDKLQTLSERTTNLLDKVNAGEISRAAGIKELDKIMAQRDALTSQADALLGSSGAFFGAESARMGEARTTNITVNMGVVGDPEGAARAVEQVFQDSLARGGISSTVGAYDR